MSSPCTGCGAPDAKHYVGAGLWACFACWLKLLLGR